MLIKSRKPSSASENTVTPEHIYLNRRSIIKGLGFGAVGLAGQAHAGILDSLLGKDDEKQPDSSLKTLSYAAHKPASELTLTPEFKVKNHNNFYEFGTDKTDPADNAHTLKVEPWTLSVEGEVAKPAKVDVWELINSAELEERIYRMRCVEAWSMVIPWIGLELGKFLQKFEPTSRAKFVAFETLYAPEQMPGQKSRFMGGGIDYPYVEGLRMDEAMNPLTLLAMGLYGKALPAQNGAPIRLVVPWKYGFKGIKSIVKLKLVEAMPPTTWNILAPSEYGFYANVNPAVNHPRWSQASERFIGPGGPLSTTRQATLPFNGYGDQVASLYSSMDLRRFY